MTRAQEKKSDKIHPIKIKKSVDKSTIEYLQKFKPVVVPKGLRQQVMSVNYKSVFSGLLGAKKTEVIILPFLLARTAPGHH